MNSYTLMVDEFPAKQWPGLGLRTSLRFEDLINGGESLVGPLQYSSDVRRAIDKYAETHDSFNIYCTGQYIGGTEV